jgi:hypothetical protein
MEKLRGSSSLSPLFLGGGGGKKYDDRWRLLLTG